MARAALLLLAASLLALGCGVRGLPRPPHAGVPAETPADAGCASCQERDH